MMVRKGVTMPDASEQGNNRHSNGRFLPGVSGNPGGRPPGKTLGALLRAALGADDGAGRTRGERLAEVLVSLALDGDVRAIREVFDRVDGKPRQALEIDTGNAGPVVVKMLAGVSVNDLR
jgi:hypothetical protein